MVEAPGRLDTRPAPREKTTLEKGLAQLSQGIIEDRRAQRESDALKDIYGQHMKDGQNIDDAIRGIQTDSRLSPTTKVSTINQLTQMKQYNYKQAKDIENRIAKENKNKPKLAPDERAQRVKRLVDEEGFTEGEAEEYLDSTPGVQQTMWRSHNEGKQRNLRGKPQQQAAQGKPKPSLAPNVVGTGDQPPDGPLEVEDSFSNEAEPIDENAWPDIPPPPKMTPAEEVKWGNQNQKENNKLLGETRKKTDAVRGIGIRLNRLASLSEKIPDGLGRSVINPETGEPYPYATLAKIGVSKEMQDYVKTLNDFLIDAKAYFGSRVTNFDVNAFKSRLPSLLNTADGRRLIIKQMQLMNDLESLHAVTLEDGLKTYGRNASYSDILSATDNKTVTKEERIIQKINDLDTASDYMDLMAKNPQKYKDTTLMQNPKGEFKAMPKAKVNQALNAKWTVY